MEEEVKIPLNPTVCRAEPEIAVWRQTMSKRALFTLSIALFLGFTLAGQALSTEKKANVEAQLKSLQALGSDQTVVKAVKEYNSAPPAEGKGMTQDKWAALSLLSPEVKFFAKNPLAEYLKTKRTDSISELFVSIADGTKAAFFAKTSSWSHKGKPKHDTPMSGKTWIGDPAMDESTGKMEVQVSFPVLDGTTPIGSIVVGLDLSKL
jgi:hypothetical protein